VEKVGVFAQLRDTCWSRSWPATYNVGHSQIVLPRLLGRRHEPQTAALHAYIQSLVSTIKARSAAGQASAMTKDRRLTKSEDRVRAGQIKKIVDGCCICTIRPSDVDQPGLEPCQRLRLGKLRDPGTPCPASCAGYRWYVRQAAEPPPDRRMDTPSERRFDIGTEPRSDAESAEAMRSRRSER